jgi:hypothetical protein
VHLSAEEFEEVVVAVVDFIEADGTTDWAKALHDGVRANAGNVSRDFRYRRCHRDHLQGVSERIQTQGAGMTQQAEYLYRLAIGLVEPFGNCLERCLIVKRTPRRGSRTHSSEGQTHEPG